MGFLREVVRNGIESAGFRFERKIDWWSPIDYCLRFQKMIDERPHYSQRNTFAESAVQIAKTTTSAATSPMCVDHASPFRIPSRSDTA